MASHRYTPHTSDKDLVVAFKKGDPGAYDEMYRRHSPRVRSTCRRLLGNRADAEEATQETFLRGYQALERFNGQYQLGAWLGRIATNVCLDELRSRARKFDQVELDDDAHDARTKADTTDDRVTNKMRLTETLAGIQPLHTRALLMRAMGGMSHREIAGELEISPQQAKALLHRARNSFRRAWREASGFVLAPFAALRSLADNRSETHVSGLAVGGPAAIATAERVATGAVAVVLAVSGMSTSMPGLSENASVTDERYPSAHAPIEPSKNKNSNVRPEVPKEPPVAEEAAAEPTTVEKLSGAVGFDFKKKDEGRKGEGPRDEREGHDPFGSSSSRPTGKLEREIDEVKDRLIPDL